jgi:hypothetical protein
MNAVGAWWVYTRSKKVTLEEAAKIIHGKEHQRYPEDVLTLLDSEKS